MTTGDYCQKFGWNASELSRRASIDIRTARKVLNGGPVSPGSARRIAIAISAREGARIDPGDIEGLLDQKQSAWPPNDLAD